MLEPSPDEATPTAARGSVTLWAIGRWIVAALTLLATLAYVWMRVLGSDVAWDEGYLMITMRGFLDGHALYDDVFTQYGPVYYWLRYPLFTLLGLPLDHDSTRLLTMATWLATATLLAWGVQRATQSLLLGWFAFMQAVVHLSRLAKEPGHPQELIVLLLCGVFLALSRLPVSRLGWTIVAVLGALIAMIKINVGVYLLIGLGAFWLSETARRRAGSSRLATFLAMAVPFVLMRHHLSEPWAITYAIVAAVAFGSVVAATFALPSSGRPAASLRAAEFTLCLLAVTAVALGATLLAGTSPAGMLRGLILDPLAFPKAFAMPLQVSGWASVNALAAGACCALALSPASAGRWTATSRAGAKLVFGVVGAIVLLGQPAVQLAYLSPWMWVALVPIHPASREPARFDEQAARRVLCCICAPMLLQAYPVAGSQVNWATLLLIPVYAWCLSDALRAVAPWDRRKPRPGNDAGDGAIAPVLRPTSAAWIGSRRRLGALLATVSLLVAYPTLWLRLPRLSAEFAQGVSLELPGSRLIRLSAERVSLYRSLTAYLAQESYGFVTYPGFHSLHFWTGIDPPTRLNVTMWDVFSDAQQTRIAESLGRLQRPKIVLLRDHYLLRWRQQDPRTLRAFQRFVLEEYEELGTIGPCIVLTPKRPTAAPPTR